MIPVPELEGDRAFGNGEADRSPPWAASGSRGGETSSADVISTVVTVWGCGSAVGDDVNGGGVVETAAVVGDNNVAFSSTKGSNSFSSKPGVQALKVDTLLSDDYERKIS